MANKKFITFLTLAAIAALSVLYFNESQINSSHYSEYESIEVADYKMLALASYEVEELLAESAMNAEAIAKFLNGNLPTTTPSGNTGIPALLSQTGAFSDLVALTPSLGLIPYDMIEPFWSDGADKKRWMAVPNDGSYNTADEQITFSNDEAWDFPRGSVLIKHFEVGGQRLETRFEVKGDDDIYYYLTYKWNIAQTDATLLNAAVDEDVVVNGVTQSWHYPSRTECVSCHFPQNGSVLGPKTRNLNKSILYPSTGITMNQLVNFSELGLITEAITNGNVSTYSAVAAKDDLSASIEDRARSYIDVNCGSCHNPTVDNIAMFDARFTTPLGNQNIIYGDVVYDEGLSDPKVIIPQDVANSMAHFRMNSTQTGIEMPPIAKDVVDTAGVQLIQDWINSLTPTTSSPPIALFSASTVNGSAPLSVDFDASASTDADGDTLTYSWDFGDGNTASGVTTSHVYTSSAEFTATLIVSDGLQSDQATTTIAVNNTNPGGNIVGFTDGTALLGQDNFSGLPMGVIDMNGDGKDDIVQFNNARTLRIQYQNGAGQLFTSFEHGNVSNQNQWGTAIADFDHNGYNDIMAGGAYDNLKIIKNNNGNNSYSQSNLFNSNIFLQGANFADINNDGWADIFACHDDAEARAFQNNQDGTLLFNENLISTETTPSSDNSGNYASMWIDYDNDGDLDLYISKCRGGATSSTDPRRINMLWQNDGDNNFIEVAEQANLKIGAQSWLSDFGDIDNDGDLDAIIINHYEGPNLMRNNGDGTFTEITSGSGLLPTLDSQNITGIQGFFKDLNNDGYIDLMVSGTDSHFLFYNNGDGTFQNAINPFNSDQIHSFSVGDINHDGFLDIYAGYANGFNSPTTIKDRIWLNQGNSNNFLNIQLEGTVSNINGIGARVELHGTWGIQIRDVKSGEGYGLVNSFTQHYGIGVSSQVEKVVVRWPSGIVDEIMNPAINQFLQIIESQPTPTCTDGIQNGDETGVDCGGSCPDACPVTPTCTDGIQNGDETGIDCGGSCPDVCPCTENVIVISITFDDYPQETSWSIQDNSGAIVASGGTYADQADGSTINIEECLADGCYDFIINDTYGDGICCGYGNGSFTVTANGTTVASGGSFLGSDTTNFCVNPIAYTFNNNVWSPSDPNNVASNNDTIVVEAGEAVISMNTAIDVITVEAGAALTVNTGVTLSANTTTLKSTSQLYSSLILDGSVTGTINYERHVNINGSGETGSNDLISAPLTGQEFDDFVLANPNILNNGNLYLFGPFDKVTGDYLTYAGSSTTALDAGIGYRAASSDNDTFTFTGTANNDIVTYNITNSGPTEAEWNLVGNPYPSYLNVQAFLNHEVSTGLKNINLMNTSTAAIYGYDGNVLDGWIIYNLATTTPSTLIAPGQGFFVSADPTHVPLYDLEFTPTMRATGTSDDFIIGRSQNGTSSVLSKLILSNNTKTYSTDIYFIEGTTKGLDKGYDASAYGGVSGDFSIFTNLVEDNQGLDIAIQSLPYNDFNDVVIPLGVKAQEGTVLTISLGDDSTLPTNVNVYLEDTLLKTLTLLNDSDYVFTPNTNFAGTGRFFLRYSNENITTLISGLDDILIYSYNSSSEIIIKGQLLEHSTVNIYDIHGRLVINQTLDNSNLINTVNANVLSSGVYIVQLSNGSAYKTKKMVIN
ncbi:FG-GAP-like repeat-containing protein [Psychroserpens ponticola]|uniref:FG-GAP-like repeat-containing protein n=1 Tax=Psychroserpens ponticola TaxID=2932268 RepID=A0ABY7S2E3_9FLAO|nr:FG-GAP-like repeat-containing protein [Psychroserpens ponticola]WCO03167.1 FG-GAP-like repeat-containing protein [Psychroserpens ponticola]